MLIWGIGGGVAIAAFEIARALGARTIVTSSSDEKLERARELGADVAVNHADGDVVAGREGGDRRRGRDVVVETVGEATWERSLAAAAPGGRVVVCGATSGPNPPAACTGSGGSSSTIFGSTMGTPRGLRRRLRARPQRARARPVDTRLPARRGRGAHERLEAGEQFGKIVLAIP